MSILRIKKTASGATSNEGVAPGMHGVPDLASASRHQATDRTKERMKWEKAVNKIVIECWMRSIKSF